MWLRCPPTPVGPSQSEPPFGVPKISETFTAVLHCTVTYSWLTQSQISKYVQALLLWSPLPNSAHHLFQVQPPSIKKIAKVVIALQIRNHSLKGKDSVKSPKCLIIMTTLSNSNCFTTALDCWNNLSLRRFFRPQPLHFWGLAVLSGTLDFWSLWTFSSWTSGSFWTQLGPLRHWERFNTELLNMFCFGWQVVQSTGR